MVKTFWTIALLAVGIFVIDQNIKALFLEDFRWHGECFSLILTLNKGVAFSMFAFLGEYLKYIQTALLSVVALYLLFDTETLKKYSIPIGILLGAGVGNIYDRFVHGGVVDYFYWHCGFEFAVFNFADVCIDLAIVLILYMSFRSDFKKKQN